jgi:tRNA(Ile)-lysidine synthase
MAEPPADALPAASGIRDDELPSLFDQLRAFPTVLLAVSGGADSLAALHLVARWCLLHHVTNTVMVATVDHGLRPSSAEEAAFVGQEAARLGLAHTTLRWGGDKPARGLMAGARAARYQLLCDHLGATAPAGPRAIVTGHHLDDQAETLLLRLAKASGLDGLSGMATQRLLDRARQIMLVRPLLAVPKARLEATVGALGRSWIDDETNREVRFARARLRSQVPALAAIGLTADALGLAAHRLRRARVALDQLTDTLERTAVTSHRGAYLTVDRAAWTTAPCELQIRLLARLLARMGGLSPPARLSEIETATGALTCPQAGHVTLGGCIVAGGGGRIAVFRETGRKGLAPVVLAPGQSAVFDGRFGVTLGQAATAPVVVRALTVAEFAALGTRKGWPSRAGITVPSFWRDGVFLAAPLLESGQDRGVCGHALCQVIALDRGALNDPVA